MKIKIPIFLILMAIATFLCAQSTGTLDLLLIPSMTTYKIDGKVYNYEEVKQVELPAGSYELELWAPDFAVVTDTVKITSGGTVKFIKGLRTLSPQYLEYRDIFRKYSSAKRIKGMGVSLLIASNATATFWVLRRSNKIKDHKKNALSTLTNYTQSETLAESENLGSQYTTLKSKYDKSKKLHNLKILTGLPCLAISYGLTTYFLIKQSKKKKEKPVYQEKNPFLSSILNLSPTYDISNKQWGMSTVINF